MSTTVDDETLSNFMSILSGTVTRDQAIHILKLSNNNLETAVDKYFAAGGADGLQSLLEQPVGNSWDSSAFGADRYGQKDASSATPTFTIDYAPGYEHYPHSGGPSGAPTRPSSRTSHRSNVSTHAGDAPRQSVETGQESGVISSNFGPANQDTYYDNSAWAMVPISQSTEYVPDASLFYQTRNTNEPAFLKPSTGPDYLPGLLTILHSIPLYRNALLSPNIQIDDYWLGNEWWKGHSEVQSRMVDGSATWASSSELDLIYETQRLMAFLDRTERSYASLDTLFKLDAWKQTNYSSDEPPNDELVKFLLRWSQLYKQHHPDVELDGVFRSTINIGNSVQKSFVLDVEVPEVAAEPSRDRHLYDVLDAALFDSSAQSAHITSASDVLIFRLSSTNESLDCAIPSVLCADRYLEENKSLVEKMFAQKKQREEDVTLADDQIDKLKFHRPQKSDLPVRMGALDMIKASMGAFDPEIAGNQDDPNDAAVLSQLKSLYDRVERKLADLEDEKRKARDALKVVSDSFRAPLDQDKQAGDDSPSHSSKHVYKLQGVATSSTDYYVLHPKGESENALEPWERQWWHIKYSYNTGDDATIIRSRVTAESVCADASAKSGKVLLVYANDAALSVDNLALPTPLMEFVKADNAALKDEFDRANAAWGADEEPESVPVGIGWGSPQDAVASNDNNDAGGWAMDEDPPSYNEDWNTISTRDLDQSSSNFKGPGHTLGGSGNGGDSGMSSATLTPNTDMDDDLQVVGSDEASSVQDMKEINGGIAAWAGSASNASSETVGLEPMAIAGEDGGGRGTVGISNFKPGVAGQQSDGGGGESVHVEPSKGQGHGQGREHRQTAQAPVAGDGDAHMADVQEVEAEVDHQQLGLKESMSVVGERKGG